MLKYAWLIIMALLLFLVVREFRYIGEELAEAETARSSEGSSESSQQAARLERKKAEPRAREESESKYDPSEAFERRRNILNYVCDQYSNPLQPEFLIVQNFSQLEDRRSFLLNHGLSYCFNDFASSDLLGSLFLQITEEKAESELSAMDPCSAQDLNSPEVYQETYIPLDGETSKEAGSSNEVFFQPSFRRGRCDLHYEIGRLPIKILAVQHPLERLVHLYDDLVTKKAEAFEDMSRQIRERYGLALTFKTFVDYLVNGSADFGDEVVYPEEFMPYWSVCNVCSAPFRPNIVMKYEYLNVDIVEVFRILGFDDYVEELPKDFTDAKPQGISEEAQGYFVQLPKSLIRDVHELYRADHEIFGYDPEGYVKLGYDDESR